MTRLSLAAVALTAAAVAAQPAAPPASGKYWVYVGTYTAKAGSKGIYRCELDLKTGKLSEPELAAEVVSPSFLDVAPDGKTLYAVGETSGKKGGGVYAFRIDPATGGLTRLGEITSGGAGPCHVAVDKEGKFAVVANYGGGSCQFTRLKPDGDFDGPLTFFQHAGQGGDPKRQAAPHAHCGAFDATGKLAFVVDLGLDQVKLYSVDRASGGVSPNAPDAIKLPPASGPRHIHVAPGNDWAFVNGEMDSTVNVVKLDVPAGKFEVTQSLSTLPDGKPVKGNSTAEVRIHPTGKFVYVSNRGHNSIAAFKWDGAKLTPVGHATEGIKVPRNFNIDPTGRWMLVASQDGDTVAVFDIDPETGLPKPMGNTVKVGRPVCVKFLAKP